MLVSPSISRFSRKPDLESLEIKFYSPKQLTLHWGRASDSSGSDWSAVDVLDIKNSAENESRRFDEKAVQSKFKQVLNSENFYLVLELAPEAAPRYLAFVLLEQHFNHWITDSDNKNFVITIPQHSSWDTPENRWNKALTEFNNTRAQRIQKSSIGFQEFILDQNVGFADFCLATAEDSISLTVEFCIRTDCTAHWGFLGTNRKEWIFPDSDILLPEGTCTGEPGKSVQSPLVALGPFRSILNIIVPTAVRARGVAMVLKDNSGTRWFKNQSGKDLVMTFAQEEFMWGGKEKDLAAEIIHSEVEAGSVTLMHR